MDFQNLADFAMTPLGLYSLCGKTSYRQISWSLEAARLGVIMIVSLWNLTGISAALLPRCLLNFRAIGKVKTRISRLRDFTRSCSKTSYRLVNRGPALLTHVCTLGNWCAKSHRSDTLRSESSRHRWIWNLLHKCTPRHCLLQNPSLHRLGKWLATECLSFWVAQDSELKCTNKAKVVKHVSYTL